MASPILPVPAYLYGCAALLISTLHKLSSDRRSEACFGSPILHPLPISSQVCQPPFFISSKVYRLDPKSACTSTCTMSSGGNGYYRHPCIYKYLRNCPNWVWQNGDACGECQVCVHSSNTMGSALTKGHLLVGERSPISKMLRCTK